MERRFDSRTMSEYSTRQVREILGLSPALIARFIEAGFVKPRRGARREYRFSFQDLVVLRAARGLEQAKLPARRMSRSLRRLRACLPAELPSSGLKIAALGDDVIVIEGRRRWRALDGQYLLAFEVAAPRGEVLFVEPPAPARRSAEELYAEACRMEEVDTAKALLLYGEALAGGQCAAGLYVNLGRLLHEKGDHSEAEAVYRSGLEHYPGEALLAFNCAVLMEDRRRTDDAIELYRKALAIDPKLSDAHYNLALLYEASGKAREAIRHLNAYRKLAG